MEIIIKMYKLPGITQRPLSSNSRNLAVKPSRKRVKRVYGPNDSGLKSRVIFNNHMLANTKENQENQPKQSNLYALKNLKFYGCKNMNVLVGAPLYCNEELSWPEKNNKSFDDITKKFKKRRKIRKAKSATRLRIMNPDSQLISVSTSKVYKSYGTKLLDNLLAKEKERQEVKPLFKHNITAKMRSKMIDWMVE
jgi:hypothetical protein